MNQAHSPFCKQSRPSKSKVEIFDEASYKSARADQNQFSFRLDTINIYSTTPKGQRPKKDKVQYLGESVHQHEQKICYQYD